MGPSIESLSTTTLTPRHVDDDFDIWSPTLPKDEEKCSASLPRIPRRQASMECDFAEYEEESKKETSPRLPRRKLSKHDLLDDDDDDSWTDFLPMTMPERKHSSEQLGRRPHRHSCPGVHDGLNNHFQYISDPDAGGSRPKMPQRFKSIRKLAESGLTPPRRQRAASGHL
ncbi:expressed unknown protein [Seminavis robusta]|uniref:Uncharacterized protein n=1 Tax=Seminavis robusta TaxID=568900 RepID=A0A9N8E088_9STRA|nr:expressed unknown protein [Seminavis robusta]|eukprot:Sro521_g159230.1 n/a (170) ;mRNA; f:4848-5357